jgi:sec-independent protein translocase protein TatA
MSMGFWQIVVIAILGVLLFGRGRISDLMGDVAKGIKSFKKGLADTEDDNLVNQHSKTSTSEKSKIQNHLQSSETVIDVTPKPQEIHNK